MTCSLFPAASIALPLPLSLLVRHFPPSTHPAPRQSPSPPLSWSSGGELSRGASPACLLSPPPGAPLSSRGGGGVATAHSQHVAVSLLSSLQPLLHRSSAWLRTAVVGEVRQEVAKWIHFSRGHRKGSKRKRVEPKVNFKAVIPEQLVLLLELLLDEPDLSLTVLRALEKTYHLQERDAEVRHRWCELVVKHKHTAAYKDVERFLLQDQAMGVYLYGELMVHEDAYQQALARSCFSQTQEEMDPAVRKVVEEMIY